MWLVIFMCETNARELRRQPSSRAHPSTSQEMRRASRGLRACGRRPEHVPGFTGNQEIPSEHARVGRIQASIFNISTDRIQLFKSQSAATLPPVNTEEPLLNYVISYKLKLEEA